MSARPERGIDPRIAHSRIVILRAAVDELADHGYGGVTIEGVAARAGVAKSTIYRHWPDRLELIADAFETFHEQMVPDTLGSPPRETIATLLAHVAEVVTDSTFSRCIPALIEGAERDPRVRDFHHRYSAVRRSVLVELVGRGVREGSISGDVDPELATAALLGAIFYRRLMTGEPLAAGEVNRLLITVLGVAPSVDDPYLQLP